MLLLQGCHVVWRERGCVERCVQVMVAAHVGSTKLWLWPACSNWPQALWVVKRLLSTLELDWLLVTQPGGAAWQASTLLAGQLRILARLWVASGPQLMVLASWTG